MKRALKLMQAILAIIMLFAVTPAMADKTTESEGTSFWFGIPFCDKSSDETLRGSETNSPYELFITSKVNTTVRVFIGKENLYKTVSVLANKPMVVALPDGFMNETSEKVEKKGFFIESDDPIAVVVYVSWQWTGEAYRIVPSEWLGTKYYTLNLYQDYNKDHAGSFRYHPAQILVVASENETDLTYTPTYETQKGVKKGQAKTVRLNQGETFNIMGKIDAPYTHTWESDLTGTLISSTKPVAVYSGVTKGSFPRHSATMLGLKSDFMRNMYMDAMWPIDLLGTDYISAPIMYTGRTAGYGTVPEDRGDIIRFVATENGTIIQQMKDDGSGFTRLAGPLKAGEDYRIMESLTPGYYKANKKVLVGQYGKSWWLSAVHAKVDGEDSKEGDELMNPPKCGQGMMFALTPNSHWCNYSGFNSPKGGMYNYVNLICQTAHVDSILFDNRKLKDEFGSKVKRIPGTIYSYVSATVNAGGHVVQSTKNSVTFAVYSYGNLDGGKDGFAYGYPAAVNYLAPCNDAISITATASCDTIYGTVTTEDLQTDVTCAGLLKLEYDKESTQFAKFVKGPFKIGDKTADFKVIFRNNRTDSITVRAMTKSGNSVSKTYYYSPELIESDKASVTFGILELNKAAERIFTVTNTGTKVAHLNRIYFSDESATEYTIIEPTVLTNIDLAPGQTLPVKVSVITGNPDAGTLRAEIWAELNCYKERLTILTASPGEPDLMINDLPWPPTPANTWAAKKTVEVKNSGNADAYLYGITFPNPDSDGEHFQLLSPLSWTLDNPYVLAPNTSVTFDVQYNPLAEADGTIHSTVATFLTNATKTKLTSTWTGSGITAGPTIEGYDWGGVRVIDEWQVNKNGITKYPAVVKVSAVGNTDLEVTGIEVLSDDQVFVLDEDAKKALKENGLKYNAPAIEIPVDFIPKEQIDYSTIVRLTTRFNGKETVVEATLKGYGLQPHVAVKDLDCGKLDLTKSTQQTKDTIITFRFNSTAPYYEMKLSVYDLKIEGANADKFRINTSNFTMPTATNPIEVNIDGVIDVPIIFDPQVSGKFSANIVATTDAPAVDDNVGKLDGEAMFYEASTTPFTFIPTFMQTKCETKGIVKFINTGDEDLIILEALNQENITKFGDISQFQVIESYLTSAPTIKYAGNTDKNIRVPAKDELNVVVEFAPSDVANYTAVIRYIYNLENSTEPNMTLESTVNGPGMDYHLVTKIPTGYKGTPDDIFGEEGKEPIEVQLYRDPNKETKQIAEAKITEFKVFVKFSTNLDINEKDVWPLVESGSDIIHSGTMTEGWNIETAILDNSELLVHFTAPSGKVLTSTDDNILFKFKMAAYLSDLNAIPLVPTLEIVDHSNVYVKKEAVLGDVIIEKVCIDKARLIQFSGLNYQAGLVSPNPVQNIGTITYVVPINCTVNIDIFNVQGERVTNLVNRRHTPGEYKASIDTDALGLPSGVYTYKIEMGPYSEVRTLVIQK